MTLPKPCSFIVVLALAFSGAAHAAPSTSQTLKVALEAMLESDQRFRAHIAEQEAELGAESPKVQASWEAQSKIDESNMAKLKEFVDKSGWPKRSEVGAKAASAAFLVLQHADLATQEHYIPIFREAAGAGEADLSDLALLEDRVLVRNGKKQIYGSQLHPDEATGKTVFYPIEDEINVDKRRASVGLEPIAEYAKYFDIIYTPPSGG